MTEYIFQIDNVSAGSTITISDAPTGLTAKNILAILNKTTAKPVHSPIADNIQSVSYSGTTLTITLKSGAPTIAGNLLIKAYKDGSDIDTTTLAKETTAEAAKQAALDAKTAAQAITGYATETNATQNKNAIIAEIQANAGVPTLTIPSTTASQELAPNTLYIFAERTSTLNLTLGAPIVGVANEYHFFVVCGSTAPTINFPAGITWNGGSAPTIAADKTYEVSILNNVAAYFEV